MRKKRIVVAHAQIPFVYGGAERHVQNLAGQLKKRGYDVDCVQLPYKWYPPESLYDNLLMWRLLDLEEVEGKKIDLVIGTKFPSYGIVHPNKVAWVIHQYRQAYDLYESPYGLAQDPRGEQIRQIVKNYDNITLKECKKIFANSMTVSNRLRQYNKVQAKTLYHPPALAGQYYCNDFQNYILSVGRLDKLKRNDLLIQALPYCDKKIRVKIAGEGKEKRELEKLASQLGVKDRVDFLGFVPDDHLIELYANARMVYFAPIDEDYGYITLEAFLSGKPVITCDDSGGVLEFVEDGETGLVCSPNEQLLGECINENFSNENMLKQFGREGYQKVKDISWDKVIDQLTKTI